VVCGVLGLARDSEADFFSASSRPSTGLFVCFVRLGRLPCLVGARLDRFHIVCQVVCKTLLGNVVFSVNICANKKA
jgi:hypothetical protein